MAKYKVAWRTRGDKIVEAAHEEEAVSKVLADNPALGVDDIEWVEEVEGVV